MENYKNKFKYVIICMFCIGVLALLSFLDFDNNSKKAPKSNENKQEKKIKSYTYKDIENMNDEEIKIFQLIKLIICLNLLEIYTMKEQMSYIK